MAYAYQDVKLRAAFCLGHVLRMHAPETPYEQKALEVGTQTLVLCICVLRFSLSSYLALVRVTGSCYMPQEVFGLFLQVFRRLDAPKAPSFQLCVSVLDIVSQVNDQPMNIMWYYCTLTPGLYLTAMVVLLQTKCCLLALDFDTDDVMCDVFQLMLDIIRWALALIYPALGQRVLTKAQVHNVSQCTKSLCWSAHKIQMLSLNGCCLPAQWWQRPVYRSCDFTCKLPSQYELGKFLCLQHIPALHGFWGYPCPLRTVKPTLLNWYDML